MTLTAAEVAAAVAVAVSDVDDGDLDLPLATDELNGDDVADYYCYQYYSCYHAMHP